MYFIDIISNMRKNCKRKANVQHSTQLQTKKYKKTKILARKRAEVVQHPTKENFKQLNRNVVNARLI